MEIVFDIETPMVADWLNLSDVKEILCMAISIDGAEPKTVDMEYGLLLLSTADTVIGHNIQSFDIPALKRVYPKFEISGQVFDTLIVSRLLHADIRERDFLLPEFPKELVGSHSLKAWGYRLGLGKGQAPEFTTSEELNAYCRQDVRVTHRLYKHLLNHPSMPEAVKAITLEHEFSAIIRKQERTGFPFDIKGAERLHAELRKELLGLEQEMQKIFPPKVIERVSEKTGKAMKSKTEVFNPGSRLQIAERLMERYQWKPIELTPDGRPRIDEAVLSDLPYPEAKTLCRYLTIIKRLGQVADGDEAWLRAVATDGRIHGLVNTNGAITGRCTHRSPNLAQVPKEPEYRALFLPAANEVLVGVDASGLELRCLAHYLGKYDGGVYAATILTGDIHWENAKAFGLTTDAVQDKTNPTHKQARDQAKGAIYALIYGAGNDKLGFVLGGTGARGKKARMNFEAKVPAYAALKADVTQLMTTRGWMRGLDSRPLYPRSTHAALNTLLQSAGAVVMKEACVIAHRNFALQSIPVKQVATVHDEYQFTVNAAYAETVGNIVVQAIQEAGKYYKFRCKLDGVHRSGANWAETH